MATKPAKKCPRRLYGEVLEQRLLFSADALPGLDGPAVDDQVVTADVDSGQHNDPPAGEVLDQPSAQTAPAAGPELVFVNENVSNYKELIADFQGQDETRTIETIVLTSNGNGIDQVTDILSDRSDLAAIHFITHGTDGRISLGGKIGRAHV